MLTAQRRIQPQAKIELLAPGATIPYLTYTLSSAQILSVNASSTGGMGTVPLEELELSYEGSSSPTAQPPQLAFNATAATPPVSDVVGRAMLDTPGGALLTFDLLGHAWGLAESCSSTGTCSVRAGLFTITKPVGDDSPHIHADWKSLNLESYDYRLVTVELFAPNTTTTAFRYNLRNVVVRDVKTLASGATGDPPTEELALAIGLDVTEQNVTPPVSYCFDIRRPNLPC